MPTHDVTAPPTCPVALSVATTEYVARAVAGASSASVARNVGTRRDDSTTRLYTVSHPPVRLARRRIQRVGRTQPCPKRAASGAAAGAADGIGWYRHRSGTASSVAASDAATMTRSPLLSESLRATGSRRAASLSAKSAGDR